MNSNKMNSNLSRALWLLVDFISFRFISVEISSIAVYAF